MKLKSLAEIAFDGHQVFAGPDRKFNCKFTELSDEDRLMFERIADRVYAEVLMRLETDQDHLVSVFMPNLNDVEVK